MREGDEHIKKLQGPRPGLAPPQASIFHPYSGSLGPEDYPCTFLNLTANQPKKYWCSGHKMTFDGLGK